MKFEPVPLNANKISELAKKYTSLAAELDVPETSRLAFSCIDLTTLNATDTVAGVAAFTQKVNQFKLQFPGLPNVAAICVYPNMASVVKENLAVANVHVAAVAGSFPSSMTFLPLKIEEARQAVIHGADEIDIVLPLWAFLGESYDHCRQEIRAIKDAIGEAHLKVILESGILADAGLIWKASLLSLQAGADFIKTSTGKMAVSATPEAAVIMCHALKHWHEATGEKRGFKPAGGISNANDAFVYVTIVKEILGEEWLNNKLFRIGASRLANNLLTGMLQTETVHF